MKTLKHLLLIMIALASLGSAKAQCYVGTYAVPNGATVQFYVDPDSSAWVNATSAYWDFGDGDTAHTGHTQHTYAASGTYTFCYHLESPGCNVDTCYDVTVNVCDFNPQITYTQEYDSYLTTFGVDNPQPGATYAWTIYGYGTTNTSTLANPQYTFSSPIVTSARVTVTLANGCVDTALAYVYINEPCGGGAHPYIYQTGVGSYNFMGDSLGTLSWDLGDGTTSTQPYFNHSYAASGTYIVCLTRDYNGCTNTTCDTLVVDLCGFTPTTSYNYWDNDTVHFLLSDYSGISYTITWSFPGSVAVSDVNYYNPTVVYPDTGVYNYSVTLVSAGCTKTINNTVHVSPPPPVPCNAGFYYNTQASTAFLYPADSTPNRIFAWDFGDGNTSTNQFPQHSYTAAGNYNVCLTVSAGNGSCSTNFCQTVTVSAPPCLNYFAHNSMGLGEINFTAYLDSINLSAGYHWDFGDGDTLNGPNSVTHFYAASGTYYACVTLTNSVCAATLCDTVIVDICAMNIYPYYSVGSGYTATFTGSPYSNVTYAWSFPGGSPATSTAANPTVTYPGPGNYGASVTVTSSTGCMDSGYTDVYIANPCHTYIYQSQLDSTTFRFVPMHFDSMSVGPYTYAWNFGDGTTSSLDSLDHTYASYGLRNVCLITTAPGCVDTSCVDVNVAPLPPPYHYLQGSVLKGVTGACNGTLYLIRDSLGFLSVADTYTFIDSFGTGTNCSGGFIFWAPEGNYYLKAALGAADPDYADYLPTYFGNVLDWSNASQIALAGDRFSQNINLIAGVNPGGPGFVGGWVTQGAGLAIGGGYDASRANGDPIANVQVNLLTDNDVPVAAAFTDANGRYTFSNLAIGTYKVYAEVINKVPYPLNVTLTTANPTQDNVDVTINSNSAVTGLDDLRDIKLEGIYPNPVSDRTVVSIALKQNSKVKLTLTDVNGRLIQNRNLDLSSGVNRIDLDLTGEAAGIYHLSLTNDTSKKIIKISKVK
ncbi:MAG: PKD domain-containing protein [Chitinophagales bacterium]|nr:PKD domain-containing protein [Chitinophagales bacterium]